MEMSTLTILTPQMDDLGTATNCRELFAFLFPKFPFVKSLASFFSLLPAAFCLRHPAGTSQE